MRFHLWRRRKEEDLEEEIQGHLRLAMQDRIAHGESPEQAQCSARREFGNIGIIKEVTRDVWGWTWLERLGQDLRYGLRMLRRSPGFSAAAMITLALGIGANTAIFSVLDAVMLRPLPYAQLERLVTISGKSRPSVSADAIREWREQKSVFDAVEAYAFRLFIVTGDAEPENVAGAAITPGTFAMLGVQPRLGRAFGFADHELFDDRVVLISDGIWKRRFGSDPNALGQSLVLNDQKYTVVGVMPPKFKYPYPHIQLWVPLAPAPAGGIYEVGRLQKGLSPAPAQLAIDAIAARLDRERPVRAGWSAKITPLDARRINPAPRRALELISGAVGCVLLIACANGAILLLATAANRQREMAVRAALGAGRLRLVRQFLTESMVIAFLGGLCGMLLAAAGVEIMVRRAPEELTFLSSYEIGLDGRVLIFAFCLSALTGVLVGFMPALRMSGRRLNDAIKGFSHGITADRAHNRMRNTLVVAEVALSLMLMTGAGLMIRSFVRLVHVSPGFDANNLLETTLVLPGKKYPTRAHRDAFFNQLKEDVSKAPGVVGVTYAGGVPPRRASFSFGVEVEIEGRKVEKLDPKVLLPFYEVDVDYFRVLRIPLLRGRAFGAQDTANSPPVIIVNDEMARRFWLGENPIGKRLRFESGNPWLTVVGIAGDVKAMGLRDETGSMEMYYPWDQASPIEGVLVVRTAGDPAGCIAMIKQHVWRLDKNQPIAEINTGAGQVDAALAESRFYLLLMASFAGISILLAVAGIYSVISCLVAQRTHEIGIRMALGAHGLDVLRLVLGPGAVLTGAGLALGLASGLGMMRLLSSLLFEISPADPATLVAASLAMLLVALSACLVPARRATKVDPLVALRCE